MPITELNQLVEALQTAPSDKFFSVAKHIHLSQKDVLPYATWSKTHHTRNCIAVNDRFELILICWGPGQCTDIHDHGGEECWVKVIEGEFKETIYKKNKEVVVEALKSSKSAIQFVDESLKNDKDVVALISIKPIEIKDSEENEDLPF
mgnify:CR=1 FL=1